MHAGKLSWSPRWVRSEVPTGVCKGWYVTFHIKSYQHGLQGTLVNLERDHLVWSTKCQISGTALQKSKRGDSGGQRGQSQLHRQWETWSWAWHQRSREEDFSWCTVWGAPGSGWNVRFTRERGWEQCWGDSLGLGQGPSSCHLGLESSLWWGSCSGHCGRWSSTPGLCPLDSRAPLQLRQHKCLQVWPNVCRGNNCLQLRPHWSRLD